MITTVMHWRHCNFVPAALSTGQQIRGWTCWVYTSDVTFFQEWMIENMKGVYDVTHRFNSGDPVITVWISSDEDASLFRLKWDETFK